MSKVHKNLRFLAALLGIACCPPVLVAQIEIAEDLVVDLTADHVSAGSPVWVNEGSGSDFDRIGLPMVEEVAGATAVTFNGVDDVYQSQENAPGGLVGLDPTRSIEAWVFNPVIADEETIVSWGHRGGPNGSNVSFNYGLNANFGAIGHWGGPDIGWATVPVANQWHHLVYTYDGTTTRVYADGTQTNSEVLGAGAVNTHADTKITVAAQLEGDGVTITQGLRGSLSIARLRVHDGVLTPEQIANNFNVDGVEFLELQAPTISGAPIADEVFPPFPTEYRVSLAATGFPLPGWQILSPEGATIDASGEILYIVPAAPPASFVVTARAVNSEGQDEVSWTVDVQADPCANLPFDCAGQLLVALDAEDLPEGDLAFGDEWENAGSLGDFTVVGGNPTVGTVGCPGDVGGGVFAVTFDGVNDIIESVALAPNSIVGQDPQRSVEAWVMNPAIANEETILSWGHRGGGDGTNMSFNYGLSGDFGAIGHWGGPDIGWNDVPAAGEWHHLVYTYDGETTRVYSDGVLRNEEFLGQGVINTHTGTKIAIGSQYEADGVTHTGGLRGSMHYAVIRIHDGVLTDDQILSNFEEEVDRFCPPPPPIPPSFDRFPDADFVYTGNQEYTAIVSAAGDPLPGLEVLEPPGSSIEVGNSLTGLREDRRALGYLRAPVPAAGDSFDVRVRASSPEGQVDASWTVSIVDPPAPADPLQVVGELFVDLDIENYEQGDQVWLNDGTLDDFEVVGTDGLLPGDPLVNGPLVEEISGRSSGHSGALFDGLDDALQCRSPTPGGLTGPAPTRSIEVWAFNELVDNEETLLCWGKRGGPAGTNMSFNYGTNGNFGAVGHWDLNGPDLGWIDNNFTMGAPEAGEWHHLVYTFDGATTRVYADGQLSNEETLAVTSVNTFPDPRITLASQIEADGVLLTPALKGSLALARVRIHDGVLRPEQVAHNFSVESSEFLPDFAPDFVCNGGPCGDDRIEEKAAIYTRALQVAGRPAPELQLLAPAEGQIDLDGSGNLVFSYPIPSPLPGSFEVEIRASNGEGEATVGWTVFVVGTPPLFDLETAGEVFVDLDAADDSAGTELWENRGTLPDFAETGDPVLEFRNGAPGVAFNGVDDAYEGGLAPEGLVGPDPTSSVEAWVLNPEIANEETIVAWGARGGPNGTNMSFNYGTSPDFGAVGHWGAPDIGWASPDLGTEVPEAGVWHHLVHTYDGETTRVYSDGELQNEEFLGPGVVNTKVDTLIALASQYQADLVTLTPGLRGSLLIGRLRIHDGVLTPEQIRSNYDTERCVYDVSVPPCDVQPPGGFRRGDTDASGATDISDPIFNLQAQFVGGLVFPCRDAADVDDSGVVDISDPIYNLQWQFVGGIDPPPAPGPENCGPDPSVDGLDCAAYPQEKC